MKRFNVTLLLITQNLNHLSNYLHYFGTKKKIHTRINVLSMPKMCVFEDMRTVGQTEMSPLLFALSIVINSVCIKHSTLFTLNTTIWL